MKSIFTFLLFITMASGLQAQLNMELRGQVEYEITLNDVWGYADDLGNEYALVGAVNGVSIVNVTNPDEPVEVAFLDGVNSTWRDMKTWKTNAYVTNETGAGLMVIDLSNLPNGATAYNWSPNIPGVGTFTACHNIFIDEFGIAYLAGSTLNNGGLLYVNVDTPDGTPEYIDKGSSAYSHDVYVRNNISYSSEIEEGVFSIYDVSDKSNTILLGQQSTPATTTHNAWLSDNSQYLFTTDETGNAPIGSYDISDPTDIIELDQFKPFETLGEGVVPHNVHVWNDFIIISFYSDGCLVLDASHPDNLVEVGNFDTWLTSSGGFSGAWGAYPFLPSETVLVTDQQNGLYVMTPTYVRAALMEGMVTNSTNSNPIPGATVSILSTSTFDIANISGNYKTGYHTGGDYMIEAKAPGFQTKEVAVTLVNDETAILNIELDPLSSFSVQVSVTDEQSGDPIPNAVVKIYNDDYEFDMNANAQGSLTLDNVFDGTYDVAVGKWGYNSKLFTGIAIDENTGSTSFQISEGLSDNFNVDLGWVVSGNAQTGAWERVIPAGIYIPEIDIFITPPEDDQTDEGPNAYVTDNGLDIFQNRVSGGTTTITSPIFDMSDYNEPKISYSTWLLAADSDAVPGTQTIWVNISNGESTKQLSNIGMDNLYSLDWLSTEINVKDFIQPTDQMQLSVSIGNTSNNVVEGGFDNFKGWDADPISSTSAPIGKKYFKVQPNPSVEGFEVKGQFEDFDSGTLTIYSLLGQALEQHNLRAGDASMQIGGSWHPGIYLAQLSVDNLPVKTIRLIKNK